MSVKRAKCPKCQQAFGVLERQLGSDVYCPHCGQKVRLPAPQVKGESLQEAAASQMFAGPKESASPAADAVDAAFGQPRKPQREAVPVKMAQPAPPPGSQTGLARNLDLDYEEDRGALATAPVRSKTTLWIWGTLIILLLIGMVVGIIVRQSQLSAARAAERERETSRPSRPTRSAYGMGKATTESTSTELTEEDMARATGTETEVVTEPLPLTFHRLGDTIFYMKDKAQHEVQVGYVENFTDKVVRRVVLTMKAVAADGQTVYGEERFVFCDMKPGEQAYFAFDFKYLGQLARIEHSMMTDITNEPEHVFEVTHRRPKVEGYKKGHVQCEVANATSTTAPVVDVTLVFFDRHGTPSGYARSQLTALRGGETREIQVPWTDWPSDGIEVVKSRAQIGGQ